MPRELRLRRLGRHLDLPDGPAIASREVLHALGHGAQIPLGVCDARLAPPGRLLGEGSDQRDPLMSDSTEPRYSKTLRFI